MMRWIRWDDSKGAPPIYAMPHGYGWIVLQEFNEIVGIWIDILIHIESKE